MTRIGIHQPNFFPWLGFFSKIVSSDVFVVLDDVQLPSGGGWSNRSLFAVNKEPRWVTAQLDKDSRKYGELRKVLFQENEWRKKMIRTLEFEYAKAPYFKQEWDFWREQIEYPKNSLVDFNMNAIDHFLNQFAPEKVELVYSSTLGITTTGTQRLVDICKRLNGTEYVFGEGASGYHEDELFSSAGITLRPLAYKQPEEFLLPGHSDGLSFLDSLFRVGPDAIKRHLESQAAKFTQ